MNISFDIKEVPGEPVDIQQINKYYSMAGMSFNQMYKQSGAAEAGVSYKDWISGEESLYNNKIESGRIRGQMPFNQWMELRWQGKLNATGKLGGIVEGLKGIGKNILDKTILNKQGTTTGAATENGGGEPGATEYVQPEKRILGMKPVIFWSLTGVLVLSAGFLTVKAIKKMRAK